MQGHHRVGGRWGRSAVTALAVGVLGIVAAVPAAADRAEGSFQQTNLVSDIAGMAKFTDADLKNPWGLSSAPTSPIWVADNNKGVTTLYLGDGVKVALGTPPNQIDNVQIPAPPPPGQPGGAPTGTVFNGTSDFVVSRGKNSGPARFLFATEDGTIVGWNPGVNFASGVIAVDNSTAVYAPSVVGAVYKGLAMASDDGKNYLYAANFRSGKVDVFNGAFQQQSWEHAFTDRHIPAGYAPFGIQTLNGLVYVTYAVQNVAKHDDVSGAGNGFVDVFTPGGELERRLIRHGALDSPWGLAIAPAGWGEFAGDLLVGNFGDGRINAYSLQSGRLRGSLTDSQGQAISIDGLWGLRFGNGSAGASTNALYFAAGIKGEADGLFGTLTPNSEEQGSGGE
jgi:uncharacterized protein (TIGR03118 family)